MNKRTCVISCPIDVWSGYGRRSVDFVKALIKAKDNEWDIKILSQRWGNCPFGYLEAHNEQDLIQRILPQLNYQPEIWFQITIPPEFQPIGRVFSCGVTAGIETTICDASWIEGINRMNLTLVSSEHAKNVFKTSEFEQRDKQTNQLIKKIKLEKPVEVLFEGISTEIFQPVEWVD